MGDRRATPASDDGARCIVFGAADRHNLGDLLIAQCVGALLAPRRVMHAGLATRDLRALGGQRVRAIAGLAASLARHPGRSGAPGVTLIHSGGEILTTTAWQAAAMLLPPDRAPAAIALLERDSAARDAWVAERLETRVRAPYAAGASFFESASPAVRCVYVGAGGVDLDRTDPPLRHEVFAALRGAAAVTVRDEVTLGHLRGAGIHATLLPDAAVMVAALFGPRIADAGSTGELARLRNRFARGFVAVQCSAEFADDATLDTLARGLDGLHRDTGCGLVLFRAGTAPWHDRLDVLQRLAARLPGSAVQVLRTTRVWPLVALIAQSRGVIASSLHARIVALAFARPRLTLRAPVSMARKHRAFAATWDADEPAGVVDAAQLADAFACCLTRDAASRVAEARRLVARFRHGFGQIAR